jgi:hypothetical protein
MSVARSFPGHANTARALQSPSHVQMPKERFYFKAFSATAKRRAAPYEAKLKAEETADMQIWTARPTCRSL